MWVDEQSRQAVVSVPSGSPKRLWIAVGILALVVLIGGLAYGWFSGWGPLARKGWTNQAGWSATVGRVYGPSVPQEETLSCIQGRPSFLYYLYGDYWRDPPSSIMKMAPRGTLPYDPSATMPSGAVFTGWHLGDQSLWVDPKEMMGGGKAHLNVYLRFPDRVERLPDIPMGCA